MKPIFYLSFFLLLTGCSQTPSTSTPPSISQPSFDPSALPYGQGIKNTREIAQLKRLLQKNIQTRWQADGATIATKGHYVKYTNNHNTKTDIHFGSNRMSVTVLNVQDPKAALKKAIADALLIPETVSQRDLYSINDFVLSSLSRPMLLGRVRDQDGQHIEWAWRANRYADYLLKNRVQRRYVGKQIAYFVDIPLRANAGLAQGHEYAALIKKAAKKYDIEEDLIYAIIKAESGFNPKAVSRSGAYGLMQVIPKTAGADVFKLVKNRNDIPSKAYLHDPANNIDTGVAYFYLLKNRYLKDVKDPTTLHYSMISAYNSGTGGLLSTFHSKDRKQAMKNLNKLSPKQAYWALTNQHPKEEARRYLEKVLHFKKEYQQFSG